jgi:glutamate formiminotransferase
MDADHNRSVITFAGSPGAVAAAAVRGVGKAVERIDLNRHRGEHPRLGAADVIPFVPVRGVTMDCCVRLAREVAEEVWRTFAVPSYLYEAAATRPERVRLENVRRGEFEGIQQSVRRDASRAPDVGGPNLHATAGACIIGARKILIAFNVNLHTDDVIVAKDIARAVRASSGGLPHVKALGLRLPSRGQTQVSMNLTDFEVTPLHVAFEAVRAEASARSVPIAGSEIVGLVPKAALEAAAGYFLQTDNLSRDLVLENRIEDTLPIGLDDILDHIADPERSTGGGSAAAMAASLAAALGGLVCRLTKTNAAAFDELRRWFSAAAERDSKAFALLMHTADPSQDGMREAAEVPLAIAEHATALEGLLRDLASTCPDGFSSDAVTATGLASAARQGAIATVRINLQRLADPRTRESFEQRLGRLE